MTRRQAFTLLACVLLVVVGLYVFNPSETEWAPKCIMLKLTGWRCPGCGIQRFVHQMMHGNFAEAVRYNYFAVLVLPYMAVLFFRELLPQGNLKGCLGRWFINRYWMYAYLVLYFVWWIIRNIYDL